MNSGTDDNDGHGACRHRIWEWRKHALEWAGQKNKYQIFVATLLARAEETDGDGSWTGTQGTWVEASELRRILEWETEG